MKISRISISNFRNIPHIIVEPHPKINVICGDNAQGKTNIIEAIWLFTGGKSFRGSQAAAFIRHGQPMAKLEMNFWGGGRENNSVLQFGENKGAWLNGVSVGSQVSFTGSFKGVVFSPAHLSIIKDGPDLRRSFLDIGICQLKPRYISVLREYQRILDHRNALLKSPAKGELLEGQIDIFDAQLARSISVIAKTRTTYLDRIAPKAMGFYEGMSQGKDKISLSYLCSISGLLEDDFSKEAVCKALLENRSRDIAAGVTTLGVHRDDMVAMVDGFPAKTHGSQGQQRSIVLALKLAEAEIFKEESGEYPVVLLDDVMSELDGSRREFLLGNLRGPQVFISCCDMLSIEGVDADNIIGVKNGDLI